MSKFEWSFIKDYAIENKLTVDQVLNKGRKGELRLCGIMDETNYPGGYLKYDWERAMSGFDFANADPGEDVDTAKQGDEFIFDNDESIQNPHVYEGGYGFGGDPEDLALYADIDGRYFLKLDQISLFALLKNNICTTPTVQRRTFERLREKKDICVCSIETDLDNVVIIITDELPYEERFETKLKKREEDSYQLIIGAMCYLLSDKINIENGPHSKNGPGAIIEQYLIDEGVGGEEGSVKRQTIATKIKNSLEFIDSERSLIKMQK